MKRRTLILGVVLAPSTIAISTCLPLRPVGARLGDGSVKQKEMSFLVEKGPKDTTLVFRVAKDRVAKDYPELFDISMVRT